MARNLDLGKCKS